MGGGAQLDRVMAHIPHIPPALLSGSGASEKSPSHKNPTAEGHSPDANVCTWWAGLKFRVERRCSRGKSLASAVLESGGTKKGDDSARSSLGVRSIP